MFTPATQNCLFGQELCLWSAAFIFALFPQQPRLCGSNEFEFLEAEER